MYIERLFRRPKKTILERDYRFFAALLSEMDLGNAYTREAQVFVWKTMKYVVKSTDEHSMPTQGLIWIWYRVMVSKFRKLTINL